MSPLFLVTQSGAEYRFVSSQVTSLRYASCWCQPKKNGLNSFRPSTASSHMEFIIRPGPSAVDSNTISVHGSSAIPCETAS